MTAGLLVAAAVLAGGRSARPSPTIAVLAGSAAAEPALGLGLGIVLGLLVGRRKLKGRRLAAEAAGSDVVLLAELVGLGASAGLSLRQSLIAAQPHLGPGLEAETNRLLERMLVGGVVSGLTKLPGHGERLYRAIARTVATGASLGRVVAAFADQARADEFTRARTRAKRLPLKIMVPLTLLVLPGFVLVTLGPTVAESLRRLVVPAP